MFNSSIGQKVKLFRYRSGLSQLDLELEINASSGSICRLESGSVNPTKETLFAIGEALELSISEKAYLFGIIDFPTENNTFVDSQLQLNS